MLTTPSKAMKLPLPSVKKAERRAAGTADGITEVRRQEALLKTGALQNAILNSANFSSIATGEKGVIQVFNVGGHFRSAGSDRACQGVDPGIRYADYAVLRSNGVQSRRTILESNQTNHPPKKRCA
jgi:hypothetical protein